MRILVFFDLPVQTKEERSLATAFRNSLLKDGYYMMQFSVYGRICNSFESAKIHENRLANFAPRNGSIRAMIVTERQYATMKIFCGKPKKAEKSNGNMQMSFF